jgi:hypothetical protein
MCKKKHDNSGRKLAKRKLDPQVGFERALLVDRKRLQPLAPDAYSWCSATMGATLAARRAGT